MRNKKINKVKVGIVVIIFLILLISFTGFARFVYQGTGDDGYANSKVFYFTSNLLDTGNPYYEYNNWSGKDTYQLEIELYSFENELLTYDGDLDYTFSCEVADDSASKISCSIGSEGSTETTISGTILEDTHTESLTVFITPIAPISLNDRLSITLTASTVEGPGMYQKTMTADVTFVITSIGADYQIEDKAYQNYTLVKLKNTYSIDAQVSIKFDPTVVRLDMNDEVYLDDDINISYVTQEINGSDYVNQVTFLMKKESSKNIKFYKVDKSKDYTNRLEIFEITRADS